MIEQLHALAAFAGDSALEAHATDRPELAIERWAWRNRLLALITDDDTPDHPHPQEHPHG